MKEETLTYTMELGNRVSRIVVHVIIVVLKSFGRSGNNLKKKTKTKYLLIEGDE